MGEVWRARDTKLGREVAIKTLPPEFAAAADRLARFEREARILAALNHPHIAAIYGLEEHEGARLPRDAGTAQGFAGRPPVEQLVPPIPSERLSGVVI